MRSNECSLTRAAIGKVGSVKKLIAPGLVALLAVAACSGSPSAPPGGQGAASQAPAATASPVAADPDDVMFLQMILPHHAQAIEMSDILLAKPGLDPRVQKLAQDIKAAQQPEMDSMRGWLAEWGAPTAASDHAGHAGMEGMLTPQQLTELRNADTAQAQDLYLRGMIAHHRGAITMANDVKAKGSDPRVLALADQIVRTQHAEIDVIQGLLGSLGR